VRENRKIQIEKGYSKLSIIIEHRGGEALSLETKVILTIGDEITNISAGDKNYLDYEAKKDEKWNVGERIVYPFEYNLSHLYAEIIAIDEKSYSIIMIGTLDIRPEGDIGVEIMVNEYPVGDNPNFIITATNYRSDIDASRAIIKITLPDHLIYQGHFTTQGDYNPNTSTWDIDNLPKGDSAILRIHMWGKPQSMTIVAELLSSTPRDINPANNKAYLTL